MNNDNGAAEIDPLAQESMAEKPGRTGAAVAWLALVLALAAGAVIGYQWWTERGAESREAVRQAELKHLQERQSELEQSLQALESALAAIGQQDDSAAIESLGAGLDRLREVVAQMDLAVAGEQAARESVHGALTDFRQRMAAVETAIAALAARGDSSGKRMDLSEVEYLLRLASERAQLFGDAGAAGRALALADERLAGMDDPLYLPVRQRIAEARRKLDEMPAADVLILSGRIAALQAVISTLPFAGETPVERPPAGAEAGLWARFKRALSTMVTVRRKVPDGGIVLSLEDRDYVRQGLWLQLESARLALMRADSVAYAQSLGRAADTVQGHFEQRATAVREAGAEIESLARVDIVTAMPDISAPWAQLQLLRRGRMEEVSQPARERERTDEAEAPKPRPEGEESADQPADDGDAPG